MPQVPVWGFTAAILVCRLAKRNSVLGFLLTISAVYYAGIGHHQSKLDPQNKIVLYKESKHQIRAQGKADY